jgi:pteridine reductase
MHPTETICERNQRLFECEAPVVFVTGSGAPRVGRRVAEYFRAQNFSLLIHAHQSTESSLTFVDEMNRLGQVAHLFTGPVQEESTVEAWVEKALDTVGRIDVLVNSAAIWWPKALEETSRRDFEEFFQVNALGTALCCKHFGLAMTRQASGGAIINVGDWAINRPYLDFAAYFLSKGSLETLTQSMAIELAHRNPRVRVNAVLPGPIQLADGISKEKQEQIRKSCLLQRDGSADDLAQAVLFLATSPFITGVCLPVDGGRTIYAGPSSDQLAHPATGREPA